MKRFFRKTVPLVAVAFVILCPPLLAPAEESAAATQEETPQDPGSRVLVKVGDIEITELEFNLQFNAGMERIPAANRHLFSNAHGRRQFLNMMVDEKLWVSAAMDAGFDKDPEVVLLTRMSRDQILMRKFYEKTIYDKSIPTQSEARLFYDANPGRFLGPATIRPRHIVLPDSATAVKVLKELKAGANLAKLAREQSIDPATAVNGGDLGSLVEGVALPPSTGGSPEYAAVLFRLKKGELSDIVRTSLGYCIARIEERTEPVLRPFEEVKERIENSLQAERAGTLRRELFEELKTKYPVEFMIEDSSVTPGAELTEPPRVATSPEGLFQAAMESKDSNQRIDIYRELLRRFPDSKYASQAQFMVGFIYSEELKDYDKAEKEFRLLLKEYPQSELVDSARWMLENMRDTSQKVGTVEDVKRKAKESSAPGEP